MCESKVLTAQEWTDIQARLKRLAEEKAHLQMMTQLMSKLQSASGLDETLEVMLRVVLETVGGTQLSVYYFIDGSIHYADVFGARKQLPAIDDPQILAVVESRRFTTWEEQFSETLMQTRPFSPSTTYVYPLLVGSELIGLIKMMGMMFQPQDFQQYLSTYFHYAALALQHQILNHSSLQKAYRALQSAHNSLHRDIELAAKVQRELLAEPFRDSLLSVTTIFQPHREVSGDFFDFAWNKENQRFSGLVLDVSGHGVSSSLQGLVLSSLFRQTLDSPMGLADRLRWINRQACRYFTDESFAAAICFEFDFTRKTISFACAGIFQFYSCCNHLPTVVRCPGSLIGISEQPDFEDHTVSFVPGDCFYFLTDGLFEQIAADMPLNLPDLARTHHQLNRLAQDPARHDDCSGVCIRIACPDEYPFYLDFIRATDRNRIQQRLRQLLKPFHPNAANQIEVAFGEALTNATRQSIRVRIKINRIGDRLIFRILDHGNGFAGNQLVRKFRDMPAEQVFENCLLAEGGRGIPIMVAWMDRVLYSRKGNEILLMKKIAEPE